MKEQITMPYTRMAIPLRCIATGESHVRQMNIYAAIGESR